MTKPNGVSSAKVNKIYQSSGQSKAVEYAENNGAEFAYCAPCECESPVQNGECLICGSMLNERTK